MPDQEQYLLRRAVEIIEQAAERALTLRTLGSAAFRLHCPQYGYLLRDEDKFNRKLGDIDFVAVKKDRVELRRFLEALGFVIDQELLMAGWGDRYVFYHPDGLEVDVFFERLSLCHVIDLGEGGRLDIDDYTLAPADLLLEKMQIVRINEKDIQDAITLTLEHPPDEGDEETINMPYVADLLAKDWGFYYTVTTNLDKLRAFLPRYPFLSERQRETVAGHVETLLAAIEAAPKTLAWTLRSRVGTRVKWYNEVDEKRR